MSEPDAPPFDPPMRCEGGPVGSPCPADPPAVTRVMLSEVEVDALSRLDAMFRSAAASIVLSRGGDPNATWRQERDERRRIVAFARESEEG